MLKAWIFQTILPLGRSSAGVGNAPGGEAVMRLALSSVPSSLSPPSHVSLDISTSPGTDFCLVSVSPLKRKCQVFKAQGERGKSSDNGKGSDNT